MKMKISNFLSAVSLYLNYSFKGKTNYLTYNHYTVEDKSNISKAKPHVLFLPGYRSNQKGKKAKSIIKHCTSKQQNVTTFDYFGHGESSGNFLEGTIGLWLENTLAMIDNIISVENSYQPKIILVGSSMGAWIMCLAALKRKYYVTGCIGIAAAPDFTQDLLCSLTNEQEQDLIRDGAVYIDNTYEGKIPITMNFLREARNHLILEKLAPTQLSCPVHLFHGDNDKDIHWHKSKLLMEKIQSENVELTLIKNGDHRLSSSSDLAIINNAIDVMSDFSN